jgi:hypothetical protein
MFAHWPVYALAASGAVTEVLEQATLHVGPLSVSQFLVIVDPIVSIALSVWIFDEYFTLGPGSHPRICVFRHHVRGRSSANVAKHARASAAEVDVASTDDAVWLRVRDDGGR